VCHHLRLPAKAPFAQQQRRAFHGERYAPAYSDLAPQDVSRCMDQKSKERPARPRTSDYINLDMTHLGVDPPQRRTGVFEIGHTLPTTSPRN
jgi:succinate dehydrogenase/fumarate reductase flavoprotein subunit